MKPPKPTRIGETMTGSQDVSLRICQFMIANNRELVFWTDDQGRFLGVNDATCNLLGYSRDELTAMLVDDIDPEINQGTRQELLAFLSLQPTVTMQSQPRRKDGTSIRMEFTIQRVILDGQVYLCTSGREIVLEKQLRDRVLEALAKGLPLSDILNLIVELAEKTCEGMIGSVLMLDSFGSLQHRSDPALPTEYCRQIDGLKPGPNMCSFGAAVHTGASVMVGDISQSPHWTNFQDLAQLAGVKACWSEPIFSPAKHVLGALAMYFPRPQVPTEQDRELMTTLAHLAGIAIDRELEHEQLVKSEIRNRSLVQSSSATVWTTSPEGGFVLPQESWESYTGQPWQEHQGFGWKNAIHIDDQDRLVETWREAIITLQPYDSYGRLWHAASGTYRHFEVRAIPIVESNRILEWVGCTTDIHDRKIAELGVQRFQAMLAQAQEVADLGSWEWSFENDRVVWSEEFCRIHGLDFDHREGDSETLIETVYLEDREQVRLAIRNAIKSGILVPMEYRIIRKDGAIKTVFSKMKFEVDSSGNNCGLIGTVLDVTDLRKTEQALLQSERQLRTITDSLPVMISYIDTDYRFQFSKTTYSSVFNTQQSSMNGQHISRLWGQAAFEQVRRNFDEAFQGISSMFEQRTGEPDKPNRISEVRLVPDENANGVVVGVYVLIDDITNRRVLEREVINIAANEHRRIGQDLHDGIGQELTGLGMIADTLLLSMSRERLSEQPLAEKLARGIKRTLGQIKSLARGLNPVDISPEGLMSALTEMALHVTELYGIDCQFTCDTVVNIADNQVATQLFRIAQEATTNSAKHGNANSIVINLCEKQGKIRLLVTDDGRGFIPSTEQRHGMGLRSMNYRAGVIGGQLNVLAREQGGTEVRCDVPQIDSGPIGSELPEQVKSQIRKVAPNDITRI